MSRRWAPRLVFALAAAALATSGPVAGQVGGVKDTVTYFDRKDGKVVSIDGEVKKETAAGVEVSLGKETRVIPSPDLIRVDYAGIPGVTKDAVSAARQFEESGDLAKAASKYGELLTKTEANPKAKRYFSYRVAAVAARVADSKAKDEEFQAEATKVAKTLADFAVANEKSWEAWPAARTAARMYAEFGDFATAAAVLGKLAKNTDLTPELRADVKLAEAAMSLRAGNAIDTLLTEIEKDPRLPATGPLRQRLAVLKVAAKFPKPAEGTRTKPAEAAAAMDKALADAADPAARAVGFNLLGDLYRTHGFPRDAMWAYLWVDVVYPQEREERVLADRRLAAVFETLGEADRAAAFREKLPTVR